MGVLEGSVDGQPPRGADVGLVAELLVMPGVKGDLGPLVSRRRTGLSSGAAADRFGPHGSAGTLAAPPTCRELARPSARGLTVAVEVLAPRAARSPGGVDGRVLRGRGYVHLGRRTPQKKKKIHKKKNQKNPKKKPSPPFPQKKKKKKKKPSKKKKNMGGDRIDSTVWGLSHLAPSGDRRRRPEAPASPSSMAADGPAADAESGPCVPLTRSTTALRWTRPFSSAKGIVMPRAFSSPDAARISRRARQRGLRPRAPDADRFIQLEMSPTPGRRNHLRPYRAGLRGRRAERGSHGLLADDQSFGRLGLGAAVRLASGDAARGLDAVPLGTWGAATEVSMGKDTPSGHWELRRRPGSPGTGTISRRPTRPFPATLVAEVCVRAGTAGILGNCHASGPLIINELGDEHVRTGWPICVHPPPTVSSSIAAHEEVFGLDRLHDLSAGRSRRRFMA